MEAFDFFGGSANYKKHISWDFNIALTYCARRKIKVPALAFNTGSRVLLRILVPVKRHANVAILSVLVTPVTDLKNHKLEERH